MSRTGLVDPTACGVASPYRMLPRTKIVQAERRTKFIWILPRRRLSKRDLFPQRSASRAQKQTEFAFCRGAACLSGTCLPQSRASRAQKQTEFAFWRGAVWLSGAHSPQSSASRAQKQTEFVFCRDAACPSGAHSPQSSARCMQKQTVFRLSIKIWMIKNQNRAFQMSHPSSHSPRRSHFSALSFEERAKEDREAKMIGKLTASR